MRLSALAAREFRFLSNKVGWPTMVINKMTEKQCLELLASASIGRLACSLDNQSYVVPVYFAYESDYIYVFSTFGQKIEWMRANPKVCMQVDEIADQTQWRSVVVNGCYQELPGPRYSDERAHGRKLLGERYHWWLNALAERRMSSSDTSIEPLFFRIHIDSMTGLHALDKGEKKVGP